MTGLNIHAETLVAVFALSVALGALNARTGFCTMGAVSDWMALGDLGRMAVGEEVQAVVQALRQRLGPVPFLGCFTFGEQGWLLDRNVHGNLMVAAVVFGAEELAR